MLQGRWASNLIPDICIFHKSHCSIFILFRQDIMSSEAVIADGAIDGDTMPFQA